MAVPYHVRFARQILVCFSNNIVDMRMRQTYNQQPQASRCDRDATGRERNEPFPGKDARGMFDQKGRSIEDWISMTARLSLAGVRYTADLWRLAIAIPLEGGGRLVGAGPSFTVYDAEGNPLIVCPRIRYDSGISVTDGGNGSRIVSIEDDEDGGFSEASRTGKATILTTSSPWIFCKGVFHRLVEACAAVARAYGIPARPCPGGVLVEAGRGAVRVMECGVLHDGTLTEPDDFLSISFGPGSAVEVEARERRKNDR